MIPINVSMIAFFKVNPNTIQSIIPEIMIPLVATQKEIEILRALVDKVAQEVQKKNNFKFQNS